MHFERTTKANKKWLMILIMQISNFLSQKKIVANLNRKNICINVFSYENDLVYPVHVLDKKFEVCMDLLLKTDKNKLHYVYIKGFNRFMCNKTKNKNKKHI